MPGHLQITIPQAYDDTGHLPSAEAASLVSALLSEPMSSSCTHGVT